MSFQVSRTSNGRRGAGVKYERLEFEEEDTSEVVLKRFLGLSSTVSFTLGMIIGTGIFLTPSGILRGTSGSVCVALIVWVVAGFIQANGALSLAELAIYYGQSGGDFVYLHDVYGPAVAFTNSFIAAFVREPSAAAIQSIVIVKFLVTPFAGDCEAVPEHGIRAGATAVIMLAIFINGLSADLTARTQVFLTFIKVSAVLLIIVLGAGKMVVDGTKGFQASFEGSGDFDWSKLPSAMFLAYFANGGWGNIASVTEEIKNPEKTLIRGMVISLTCAVTLYLLANLAYLAVLTPEEMMASDAVAALFAVRVLGVRWSFIIWLCVVLSAIGNLNGSTYTKSRLYFVTARANLFPFILSTIHVNRRTPLASILSILPPTVIAIWSADIWSIIKFTVIISLSFSILIVLIVPYHRWKFPDRKLPYKAPLPGCFIYVFFNISLLLVTSITNPWYILSGIATVAVALVFYRLHKWTGRSPRAAAASKSINIFLQKVLLSVPQEAATF